ncbi:FtsX-like permease family protein [Amycolatopsis anabasis]|uniref:FtsX-like permease family protein n=1 Tax=Amycolatopsis anabasis TaxID=1840409 RepID=UPI00131DED78|nr:FtsX-like permease family protein [Amycolatopsis anabasis]
MGVHWGKFSLGGPVLRAAPRAALASPLTLVAAAVTALLSGFLAVAAVLTASASGGAAAQYQAGTVCPDGFGPTFTMTPASITAAPALIATIERQAAAHGFAAPTIGLYAGGRYEITYQGVAYSFNLSYRDGDTDNLALLRGDRGSGLWINSEVADYARLPLPLTGTFGGAALPPVTGVYRDLYTPVPPWWCSQGTLAAHSGVADKRFHTLFATDRASFTEAATRLGARSLSFSATFPEPVPRTLGAAQDTLERSKALVAAVRADLDRQGLAGGLTAAVPFERSVGIARQAQENVAFSIMPLSVLSVLVGCAGIGTIGLQWYHRRHAQLRLLSARGSSPAALGALAVAELALPVLIGGAAGAVLAGLSLGVYGPPGGVDPPAAFAAAGIAAAVLVVSLLLPAGVVAVRSHRDFQLGRTRPRRTRRRLLALFPWELVTAGLAVLGWTRLTGARGSPLPGVDPIALTYPVCVVLTAGLLAARVVWLLLRVSHRARFWSRPALQLAIRRLASARAPVTGVLVIGVLAIGTLATGDGIAAGQRQALEEKSGLFVGANTKVDTETKLGTGAVPLPAELRGNSSLVGEITGTGSVVLVVDPATFATAAWLGDLTPERANELLHRLDVRSGPGLPAIRIGHTDAQSLALPGLPDAVPIADLPVFPLIGGKPGYVISRSSLTPEQLAAVPRWSVLSGASLETTSHALTALGLAVHNPLSKATALDALPFYVVEWTFSYVRVLGVVLGVVAVLGLLVAVELRRRQNALAGALVLRMGMSGKAMLGSHLLELGALAGFAVLIGVVCGTGVAAVSAPRFDPATWLAPRSTPPDATPFVLGVLGIGLLVVVLAGWLAVRSVRTTRTAELLRA